MSIYQKQPEGYFPNDKTEENLSHQIFILLFLDFPVCLFSMVGYKLPVDFSDVFLIQLPFIYQAEFHGISHEYFLRFFTAKKLFGWRLKINLQENLFSVGKSLIFISTCWKSVRNVWKFSSFSGILWYTMCITHACRNWYH